MPTAKKPSIDEIWIEFQKNVASEEEAKRLYDEAKSAFNKAHPLAFLNPLYIVTDEYRDFMNKYIKEASTLPVTNNLKNPSLLSEAVVRVDASILKSFNLVKSFQKFKSKAFQDPGGIWTIGYDSIYMPNGKRVKAGDTISEPDAKKMAMDYLKENKNSLQKIVTKQLSANQWSALLSLSYSGLANVKRSKIISLINNNASSEKIQAEWVQTITHQNGVELPGLVTRRIKEAFIFTGINKVPVKITPTKTTVITNEPQTKEAKGLSLLPYIIALIAIVGIYFFINKRK